MKPLLLGILFFALSTYCHGTTEKSFFKKLFETMHITGYGYTTNTNPGIIYTPQNPIFTVHYDENQEKQYQLNFTSWSITAQLSYNATLLFFVNTDPNFYKINRTIKLGWGVSGEFYWPNRSYKNFIAQMVGISYTKEVKIKKGTQSEKHSLPVETKIEINGSTSTRAPSINQILSLSNVAIRAIYISLKKTKGGILLLSLSPGITIAPYPVGLSVITGGSLSPLND